MYKYASIFLIILLLTTGMSWAGDWPTHRGSNPRLGQAAETLQPPLALAWQFRTQGKVQSSPAVYNNTVYFGSMDGCLYAVDAETGALKWQWDDGGTDVHTRGLFSSPCVSNGIVFIATRGGRVVAINADTGSLIWQYTYGGQNLSSPAVSGDLVFCGLGYPVKSVVALRATTGQKVWETATLQYVHSSPTPVGNRVYIGSNDGIMRALDITDGSVEWSFPTSGGIFVTTIAVDGTKLYSAPGDYDRRIYAFDTETWAKIWEFTVPQQSWQTWVYVSSPAVGNGSVYLVSGYPTEKLYALNATTGAKQWEFTVGPISSADLYASSPVVAGGTIYVGSWDGTLYALNAANGVKQWSVVLPGGIGSSPAVSNGMLYVGSDDGCMYAFSAADRVRSISTRPGFVKPGWNLISMPALPRNPDPLVVFSGIDIANSSLQFWKNEAEDGGYQGYGALFGWTGPVKVGTPYWLLNRDSAASLNFQGTLIATDYTLTIPAHIQTPYWAMFGHPFNHSTPCADMKFSTTSSPTPVNWLTAYANRWVESKALGYDSTVPSYFTVGVSDFSPNRTTLEPWYGYWLLIGNADGLIIHIPAASFVP